MATTVHLIDVEQGNMVLIQCSDGTNFMVDCNVTESNKNRILRYVENQIGQRGLLRAFISTHRDADHMRGVRALHQKFPIQEIWDSDHPGTSTDSDEYRTYMQLRRDVGSKIIEKKTYHDYGWTRLRYLSAKDSRSLAGKLLAGFSAIPSRRIPILYGMIVYDIRLTGSLWYR